MPICTIYNSCGEVMRDFDTDAPHMAGPITVGRSSQCTISLKGDVDRKVGRIHFSLQAENHIWTLTNCSSTLLYRNQQGVTHTRINEGDIIRFGHIFLAFGEKAGPSSYELAYVNEEGYQERRVLWPGRNTIGASSDSTICIKEMGLSRSHAQITVDPQEMLLEDLGSAHGAFLDDTRVKGTVRFKHGAVLRLGRAHCHVLQRGAPLGHHGKSGKDGFLGRGFGKWIVAALLVIGAVLLAKWRGWL